MHPIRLGKMLGMPECHFQISPALLNLESGHGLGVADPRLSHSEVGIEGRGLQSILFRNGIIALPQQHAGKQ